MKISSTTEKTYDVENKLMLIEIEVNRETLTSRSFSI